ncbi:Uncharacterised protein [uncultured archaeon]|nr:Uncharacterised protein [uncultured archaeon]
MVISMLTLISPAYGLPVVLASFGNKLSTTFFVNIVFIGLKI